MTLLQLIVMVGAARSMHTVFRRLGQPGVIGEIFAGLLLGPSLMGHFFPQVSLTLFGQHASAPITIISQIGLILLMFQIGMDFEFGHLATRRNRRATIAVTSAARVTSADTPSTFAPESPSRLHTVRMVCLGVL